VQDIPTANVATVPHGTPGRAVPRAREREGLRMERVDMTYSALWWVEIDPGGPEVLVHLGTTTSG